MVLFDPLELFSWQIEMAGCKRSQMEFLSTNVPEHNVKKLLKMCKKPKFKMDAGGQFWIWLISNFWNTNPILLCNTRVPHFRLNQWWQIHKNGYWRLAKHVIQDGGELGSNWFFTLK